MGWFHELQNDNQIYQSPFRKHLSLPQAAPRRRPISAALLTFYLPGGLRDREGSQHQGRRAPQPTPHNLFRSEEHTAELQSRGHLACRLLLEKTTNTNTNRTP